MLGHLRDERVASLQSLVSDLREVSGLSRRCQHLVWLQDESSKPLSLPANTPKRKCWERRDTSTERTISAHKPASREDTEYTSQNFSTHLDTEILL